MPYRAALELPPEFRHALADFASLSGGRIVYDGRQPRLLQ